ncbi:hypothetical protein [Pantoea ananatis]|uniref:hypothetical protein n=1 Tax=Pantoea ananas TaxID=553 RepID=UPI0023B15F91|nr:hypothetical protein [Pantoea ananatis]
MFRRLKYIIVRPFYKDGNFLHITPIENLEGIIIESVGKKEIIDNIKNHKEQICDINLTPTIHSYKNITMKGIGDNKQGYVYSFLNKVSKLNLFLNLCGRHDPKLNVCITISSRDVSSPCWLRWVDNTIIIQGKYTGKATIKRLEI